MIYDQVDAEHGWTDLGDGHWYRFTVWDPDVELNPQYAGRSLPVDPCGAQVAHPRPDGQPCMSGITFDLPELAGAFDGRPKWQVVSLAPLHVEPSLLCRACGDHGWIRDGRWVRA